MDKYWAYSLAPYLWDRKYIVLPGIIIPGEPPEDYTILLTEEEIESLFIPNNCLIPAPLRLVVRQRFFDEKRKTPITEYATSKGVKIVIEEGEIKLNPFYKPRGYYE